MIIKQCLASRLCRGFSGKKSEAQPVPGRAVFFEAGCIEPEILRARRQDIGGRVHGGMGRLQVDRI